MGKGKRRGGRTTPKGTRPGHLRAVGAPDPDTSQADDLIDTLVRDVVKEVDPVVVETWASGVLDVFDSARGRARLAGDAVPPFEEAILDRCRHRGDRAALVVAGGLAAVLPPPLDLRARRVVDELRRSVPEPPWLDTVGTAQPTRAWLASDVFGDQDALIVGFAHRAAPGEHAIVALVDHNLSGQAKDVWVAGDLDDVVRAWRSNLDPHMRMEELPVDSALSRLRDAMAMSDLWDGDVELRTEEFVRHRALVWARLRGAGLSATTGQASEVTQDERDAIVEDFLSSTHGEALMRAVDAAAVRLLAHHLVDLRSDYEGTPLRWSPSVVGILMTDLAPRKLLLDPDQAGLLPGVLRAFVRFSADRTGTDDAFTGEVLVTVDQVEQEFLDRISDPGSAGPAKTVLAALQARGVDLSDFDAVNAALADDMPMALPQGAPAQRRNPAVAPAEVVTAAERAPVLARFATLVEFYGDGRKLTQTGQPTLADARALVGALATDDRLDETIGTRTFKTRSAAELPELGFTIRWAIAAGALRKEHGKLRATATWRKLDGKPLPRWLKAADALPSLGPLAAFHAGSRYRGRDELLDELAPEIVRALRGNAMTFDVVLDWVCERADLAYEWLAPYMQDPDHRRNSFRWDLDRLVQILGWAGIVDRIGATAEPDTWDARRTRLVGGTLQLTPVGRWWLS